MPKLKTTEIKKMSMDEINRKIEELKMELIKANISASKTGTSKTREIKRLIAKLLTLNRINK